MKKFFSLMLIAFLGCAVCASCDKPEPDPNPNTPITPTDPTDNQSYVQVSFLGQTWKAQDSQCLWVPQYEQIYLLASKNANGLQQGGEMFPATDAWIYPNETPQDYFVSYFESNVWDVSAAFGWEEGSAIIGDYFWAPTQDAPEWTVSNVTFDASTLMVDRLETTIPLFNSMDYLNSDDATTYPETLILNKVQLTTPSAAKGVTKRAL